MSSFLYRLGQAAARHRWRTLGIWIAAVVAIFVVGGALGGKFSDDFKLPDSESQRAYDLLAERYPAASGTSAFVVFHSTGGPLERQADAVTSALDAIGSQPHVVAVTNPLETEGALSTDGTIGYGQVAYDEPAVDLGTVPFERLRSALDDVRSPDLDVEIGGEYASWGTQPETSSSELIGLLAAMIILLIAFGSVVAMGLPIGTAVIGLTTGTGLTIIVASFASVPDVRHDPVVDDRPGRRDRLRPVHRHALPAEPARWHGPVARDRPRERHGGPGRGVLRHHGLDRPPRPLDLGDRVRRHDGDRRGDRRPGGRRRGRHAAARAARLRRERDRQAERPPAPQAHRTRWVGKESMWSRWGHEVERHPWRYFVGAALVLVTLADPAVLDEARVPRRRHGADVGDAPSGLRPPLRGVRTGVQRPAAAGGRDRRPGRAPGARPADDGDRRDPGRGGRHAAPAEPGGRRRDHPGHPHHLAAGSSDDRAGAAPPRRHDPGCHAGGCGGPRRRGHGDVHRPLRSHHERPAVVHRCGRAAVVPVADGRVPLDPGARSRRRCSTCCRSAPPTASSS